LDQITELVNIYEKKSKKILVYQYLAKKGLIASNDNITSMTKSFADYLNSIYENGTIEEKKNLMLCHVNNLFS